MLRWSNPLFGAFPGKTGQQTLYSLGLWRKILPFAVLLTLTTVAISAEYQLEDGTTVAPLEMFQECDVCPEMIVLPLGEFMMGAPPGESKRNFHWDKKGFRFATPEEPYIAHHEGPVHPVTIDMPIAIGRNEVTHDQWMECVQDGGCGGHVPIDYIFKGNTKKLEAGGSHPVIDVSYNDAASYATWLNRKVGQSVYRLPTEAEWEYAARAGTQTPFAQGEEATTDQVNFSGNATKKMLGLELPDLISRGKPVPVEMLEASNNWGLRHMSGNVSELTLSCWADKHQNWNSSRRYVEEAVNSDCNKRAARGGAYPFAMDFSRVATRGRIRDAGRSDKLGFRVIRDLFLNN